MIVPTYIGLIFGVTTLLVIYIFYTASRKTSMALTILLGWIALQGIVALTGFYSVTNSLPPRFILLPLPPVIVIILLFATAAGRAFIDRLNIRLLTLLHIVRVPVEIVLYLLFLNGAVPELMTFEGRNFDILSGLTAPVVYYYGFVTRQLSRKVILLWNFVCLALLFNILINAIFSVPFPFQQQAFDQPNVAVLYFPYIWLPCCVVPVVLFSHLAVIRQLLRNKTEPSISL